MALKLVWRDAAWYVMGTQADPYGVKHRVRKSTGYARGDRDMAEAARRRIVQEIAAGKWGRETGEAETLGDAVDLFLRRPGGVGKTDESILRRLAADLGALKLKGLRGVDLMTWVTARGNVAGTVAREIASVTACLNYARGLGCEVPELRLRKPPVDDARTRWLTAEERDRLIDACDESVRGLVTVLFWTGARLGEAFALRWEDLVLEGERPVAVLRTRKTRGGRVKERRVPLRPVVLDELRALKEARGGRAQGRALVFVNTEGGAWERSAFYTHFDRAKERAGVEDFTPHDCRHTFASLLIRAGVRERVVAELLGHSTLSLVMRYTHLAPDHLDEVVKALDAA
jgi:integrase